MLPIETRCDRSTRSTNDTSLYRSTYCLIDFDTSVNFGKFSFVQIIRFKTSPQRSLGRLNSMSSGYFNLFDICEFLAQFNKLNVKKIFKLSSVFSEVSFLLINVCRFIIKQYILCKHHILVILFSLFFSKHSQNDKARNDSNDLKSGENRKNSTNFVHKCIKSRFYFCHATIERRI